MSNKFSYIILSTFTTLLTHMHRLWVLIIIVTIDIIVPLVVADVSTRT